jgi:hypothetical protein
MQRCRDYENIPQTYLAVTLSDIMALSCCHKAVCLPAHNRVLRGVPKTPLAGSGTTQHTRLRLRSRCVSGRIDQLSALAMLLPLLLLLLLLLLLYCGSI